MNSSRNLFLLLISCVFLLSAETSRAFAPSSLVGKLNSISIYDSESGKTYRNDNIFIMLQNKNEVYNVYNIICKNYNYV